MRTCWHVRADFKTARTHRDAVRWGVLILLGIVVGAGCATAPRSNPQSKAPPANDVGSSPQVPPSAPVSSSQPQDGRAEGPARANDDSSMPGGTDLDELEAELSQKQVSVADPLEPVNRFIFGVNDAVYSILKPVRQVYVYVVPKPARLGIRNFFHNLATPARIVNCILQGKNAGADAELQRFAINTTVGVLGFGDPALARWGLKPAEEDLGQTLAVYGLGDGFYLVWPLLGPSTLRNSMGMVGDMFMDPVFYAEPEVLAISISAVSAANDMSFRLEEYDTLKAVTVDPYIAMRDAYIQYRKKQIEDANRPPDPNRAKP